MAGFPGSLALRSHPHSHSHVHLHHGIQNPTSKRWKHYHILTFIYIYNTSPLENETTLYTYINKSTPPSCPNPCGAY
jgi:hypothetical protein